MRIFRSLSGRLSNDGGGVEYTVDSSVIRSMSHLRRWSASGSDAFGGGINSIADSIRD